jgi:hypothetical protein
MGFLRHIAGVFALIASLAMPAHATPAAIDATGLWINPAEPGWGVSVFHQGDTLFASLFVYGPDGQPKWYTASSMVGSGSTYSGQLVEATGPYLGAQAAFNPAAVTRRAVGTMALNLDSSGGDLTYTVDGTTVAKRVQRFSMRAVPFRGRYGAVVQPATGGRGEVQVLDQHISGVVDNAATLNWDTDSNRTSSCVFLGSSRSQNGETLSASGVGRCDGDPNPPGKPWSLSVVDPTPHGFTARFAGDIGNADGLTQARFAAANSSQPDLQGTGYINDLWFPPNEAGWGLNLIEQGGVAFATLFVYDAQNRPRWYSASQLAAGNNGGRPSWSGTLEESTGPYFGGPFNSSQVTRRAVGTMTFTLRENGDGALAYSVNGVNVVKTVNRFTFRRNDLSGSYVGNVVMRADDPRGVSYDDAFFTIDDQGDRVNVHLEILTGPTCDYALQGIQYGSQRSIYGDYSCAGRQGRIEMNDLMVTAEGITGSYQGPAGHIGGLITHGTISGARR